ncbi:MAG: DM13 domain-containing protein [Dehalococcoidia bacterium]
MRTPPNSPPLLSVSQADSLRRWLLGLAVVAGLGAAVAVALIEPLSDFLGEGPVRLLGLEGGARRLVIVVGSVIGTTLAVQGAGRAAGTSRTALVVGGLALALGLASVLLAPMALLVLGAVGVDVASGLPRDRVAAFGPRRRPWLWVAAAPVFVAGAAVAVWLSVFLAAPLFDEGTTLDEELGFALATSTPAAGATQAATPIVETGTVVPASASGVLVSEGSLEGTDSFHFGNGGVLLVEGPDGRGVLRFEDYEVRNGPDLHVYLTPDPDLDVHAEGAVDLGEVRATNGNVNYEVPDGLDLSTFRGVVIYCVPFSVVFASATLEVAP